MGVSLPRRHHRCDVRPSRGDRLDRGGRRERPPARRTESAQRVRAVRHHRQYVGVVLGLRRPRSIRRVPLVSWGQLGRPSVELPRIRSQEQRAGCSARRRRIPDGTGRRRRCGKSGGSGLVGSSRRAARNPPRAFAGRVDTAGAPAFSNLAAVVRAWRDSSDAPRGAGTTARTRHQRRDGSIPTIPET